MRVNKDATRQSGNLVNSERVSARKDNNFAFQRQTIFRFFSQHTTTMYAAEKETGVSRANICRYIAEMEEKGQIGRLYQGLCPVSGFRAWFFYSKKGGAR